MSKARTLANLISDNAELADGQISVAEVVGAAPTASPTFTGNIDAGDNVKIRLGDSDDLQIYHDGSNSTVRDLGTGDLIMRGTNIRLQAANGETYLYATENGDVDLYYNNSVKLSTTNTGISVTGNATFADNGKAIFGASGDLEVYHDGSHSYIQESGTGNLFVRASNLVLADVDGTQFLRGTANSDVKLYHNNDQKLATSATGISVTGTVTSDGLAVDDSLSAFYDSTATGNGDYRGAIGFGYGSWDGVTGFGRGVVLASKIESSDDDVLGLELFVHPSTAGGDASVRSASFHNNGDISFYEDTGVTPKLFWDSSAESLGLGTVSPSNSLHIASTDSTVAHFQHTDGINSHIRISDTSDSLYLVSRDGIGSIGGINSSSNSNLNIDLTSGNVGIGTSTILNVADGRGVLTLSGASSAFLNFGTGSTRWGGVYSNASKTAFVSDSVSTFEVGSTEAMRIDSSQNLLVGKTSADAGITAGVEATSSGKTYFTRDSASITASVIDVNKKTGDGSIIAIRKDGSVVGRIGALSGDLVLYSTASGHKGVRYANGYWGPTNNSGSLQDNAVDLGTGVYRFDDVYATNGTIQTSDRNEKQDIASLTATEMLVGKRISTLFKTFRWKDSVAEKGENARTHTGVIAQDVQAAFTAEGLDSGDYALFISSTWWETQTDVDAVDAVEAVAEVTDEDGNVTTEAVEAVEAVDAYTRTDTYDTEDEAPEGATERTRLGIRYPELLAFVSAYNEQRFASIEARLTALEG